MLEDEKQTLQIALEQNYTLESIHVMGTKFEEIPRLNKAGRRYLILDDATSTSKCIAVLAKVKLNLDCLFIHLRENPILCTAAVAATVVAQGVGNEENASPKRKAQKDCAADGDKKRPVV